MVVEGGRGSALLPGVGFRPFEESRRTPGFSAIDLVDLRASAFICVSAFMRNLRNLGTARRRSFTVDATFQVIENKWRTRHHFAIDPVSRFLSRVCGK
jgi:hypothetical protein